jgi:hypothetical protein
MTACVCLPASSPYTRQGTSHLPDTLLQDGALSISLHTGNAMWPWSCCTLGMTIMALPDRYVHVHLC